jgi:hypothetical protein
MGEPPMVVVDGSASKIYDHSKVPVVRPVSPRVSAPVLVDYSSSESEYESAASDLDTDDNDGTEAAE